MQTLFLTAVLVLLRLAGPLPIGTHLRLPMLPSRAGRQQGKAGIQCLTMPIFGHPRGPMPAKGAPQPQSDSTTAFPPRPRIVSEALTSSSLSFSFGLQKQGTIAPRFPWEQPPPYLRITTCKVLQASAGRAAECILSHAGHFISRVCPSLGVRLTPLPFIASPSMLPSVTPTGASQGQSCGRFPPPGLLLLPILPLVKHVNIV